MVAGCGVVLEMAMGSNRAGDARKKRLKRAKRYMARLAKKTAASNSTKKS
jgi:hypothetical protein